MVFHCRTLWQPSIFEAVAQNAGQGLHLMNFEKSVEDRHKIAAVLKVLWLFATLSEFSKFGVWCYPSNQGSVCFAFDLSFRFKLRQVACVHAAHGDGTAPNAELLALCWVTTQILERSLSVEA